jgi:hypothetical protein
MERGPMNQAVIPDTSPSELMAALRGEVVESVPGYPEVLHLTLRDKQGQTWGFSTFDSTWSPSDPDAFQGKTVRSADLDVASGKLTIGFSDDSTLTVVPTPGVEADDLENWQIFTPDGFVLDYGPGQKWCLGRGTDPC